MNWKSYLPGKVYYPMYVEERGWIKAEIPLTTCSYIEGYRLVEIF